MANEAYAFLRLSQTQRRLAHEYKRRALEDAAAGRLDSYVKHKAESDRLWQSAKWHLNHARSWMRNSMEMANAA